jgi:hypothetical protein
MANAILIQDVKVGQKFYMLNKAGLPKYNCNSTFEMTRNNGKVFEYIRIEKDKMYTSSTLYPQYVVVI